MNARFAVRRRSARTLAWLLALPLSAPLLMLLLSWRDAQPEIWEHLRAHVLAPVLADTVLLAAGVALGVSVLGLGLAWLSARCDYPGRRWLDWALVLPLALPGYVAAFAYVGLFDYAGPLQSTWRALSGSRAMFGDVRGLGGAALVLSLVLYPYVYLLARAAFLRQGAAAFDAARSLGLTPLRAFFRVALPLARPAWIAGTTLALLETLADFGTVSILGVDTVTTAIYKTWFGLTSLPAAAQLSCVLLAAVALLLLLEMATRGRGRSDERASRPMPRIRLRGGGALAASVFAGGVFALGFGLPVARLLAWAWQVEVDVLALASVAGNTLAIGALVAALTVVAGATLALAERSAPRDPWVRAPVFVANLGYAVPGTVLAVATMLGLLALERGLRDGAGIGVALSTSLVGLAFALALRFLRVAHGSADAGLRTLRPALLDAARLLGADRHRRLREIVLPLLRPSLLAALLLVGVEAMKELPATLMLRPFGWDTLAVKIYGYTSEGLWAHAATPALLLVAIGLAPVWWLARSRE